MSAPPDPDSNCVVAAHFEHVEAGRHAGVVLLHGLGGDLSQPRDYTGAVIDGRPAARLLADARLHGLTQIADPGVVTFDVLAADIEALAEAVGLPSERVLVGVSMGAGTALRLALRSQAGIRGLVLIRPAWLHEPFPANLEPFGVIAQLITEHGPVEGKRRFAELPLFKPSAPNPRAWQQVCSNSSTNPGPLSVSDGSSTFQEVHRSGIPMS